MIIIIILLANGLLFEKSLQTSDVLGELCVLLLIQKSKVGVSTVSLNIVTARGFRFYTPD